METVRIGVNTLFPDLPSALNASHDRQNFTTRRLDGVDGGEMTMAAISSASSARRPARPLYKVLYVQVLAAILLGALFGWLAPQWATNEWVKALGDGFVKLIKMVIAPIIFCTVVSGIAHISDARKVGRVAVKALVYFEIVSTFALVIGLVVGNVLRPGAGFSGAPDPALVAGFAKQAAARHSVDFVLDIIPDSVGRRFRQGRCAAGLLFSILFGFADDGARRARQEPASPWSTI